MAEGLPAAWEVILGAHGEALPARWLGMPRATYGLIRQLAPTAEERLHREFSQMLGMLAELGRHLREPHTSLASIRPTGRPRTHRGIIRHVRRALSVMQRTLGFEAVECLLLEEGTGRLRSVGHYGFSEEVVGVPLTVGEGIVGRGARTGLPALVPDVRQDPDEAS